MQMPQVRTIVKFCHGIDEVEGASRFGQNSRETPVFSTTSAERLLAQPQRLVLILEKSLQQLDEAAELFYRNQNG